MAQAQQPVQPLLPLLPLLLAVGMVFVTLHVRNHAGALKSVLTSVWRICKESVNQLPFASTKSTKSLEEEERTAQVEAGLWDVRARAYMHSVQFMVHLSAAGCLGMLYALYMNPSVKQLVQLIFCSCVYLLHHVAIAGKLTLNATNLRRLFVLFQGSFVLFVLATPQSDDGRAIITQGFNACSRMIMAVIFMDTLTAVPLQLAISVAETVVHVMQRQHSWADIILFAWMQSLVAGAIIAFTVILEHWVISHISVLLDTESMVSSFRRMLRGVSDGEVLLNEDMHVCEDADCLKHLLMTQSNFKDKHFERLLMPEETGRFQDFLKQSMAEERKPDEQRTKIPPCLRISLRGASDIRVGVDLWHVLMPGRKDGVLHLLVLREDSQANATIPTTPTTPKLPSAALAKNMPLGPLEHLGQGPSSPSTSAGSDREPSESMSQKSCTSLMQHFPELVDLTLCVDAATPWFDVEQAHLSFQRQPQTSDFSMPSLRRLVRPTDWETVRSKLKVSEVTDSSGSDLRLRLVDDAKRCMVAHGQVSKYTPPRVSRGSDGVKLCLQLTEMVFEDKADKASRDWKLEAINE